MGDYTVLDGFHFAYDLTQEGSDERKETLRLSIYRPKEFGERAIQEEWKALYQYVSDLHEKGMDQDDINALLGKRKIEKTS